MRPGWEPILVTHRPHPAGFKGSKAEHGVGGLALGGAGLTDEGDWPADVLLDETAARELDAQGEERSRFFYVAKASEANRTMDGEAANEHPTVKPLELMRWVVDLCRLPGGGERLLDPFAGSGSTLIAAARAGLEVVGIERVEDHARTSARRFVADAPLFHRDETPERSHEEDRSTAPTEEARPAS